MFFVCDSHRYLLIFFSFSLLLNNKDLGILKDCKAIQTAARENTRTNKNKMSGGPIAAAMGCLLISKIIKKTKQNFFIL